MKPYPSLAPAGAHDNGLSFSPSLKIASSVCLKDSSRLWPIGLHYCPAIFNFGSMLYVHNILVKKARLDER